MDSYGTIVNGDFLNCDQRDELEAIVRRPSAQHGVARRANAILLLDDGLNFEQIAKVLYTDDSTIRAWHRTYISSGFEGLERFDWKGARPYLSQQQEIDLADYLDKNLHRETGKIRAYIREKYQQYYSKSGCIKLMDRLGFDYKPPKRVPAQADEDKQRKIINVYNQLQSDLLPNEAVYFLDAVHPEHQSKPAYGWIKRGEKVALKSSTGRKRVNIHGAINLENFDCPFVESITVDSDSTIALLKKIETANPSKTVLYIFLDNARYHHAKAVKKWLKSTNSRIKLIFLPAYAPHLNPIERLWGVMHKYVTHNKFYRTFNEFADAILEFFEQTVPENWRDFRDRVSDNFRIIRHDDFRIL
jgi:transposase